MERQDELFEEKKRQVINEYKQMKVECNKMKKKECSITRCASTSKIHSKTLFTPTSSPDLYLTQSQPSDDIFMLDEDIDLNLRVNIISTSPCDKQDDDKEGTFPATFKDLTLEKANEERSVPEHHSFSSNIVKSMF